MVSDNGGSSGSTNAVSYGGDDYYFGRNGVNQNYTKARQDWEQAAAQGHAGALYNLGLLYEHGHGVGRDYAIALECYLKAADAGYESAPEQIIKLRDWMNC